MTLTISPKPKAPAPSGAQTKLNAAQFVLQQLKTWQVERIYGVIGDAILPLLDELGKQTGIRYIPCRHEGAAALMASAEAKLTGKPGVCMATSGPGAANLMNGLAEAQTDRAPVLAITGQVDAKEIGTKTKQYIDQQKLFAAVSARSELLAHADALPELMQQALLQSVTDGAVAQLSVPKDLWAAPVNGEVSRYPMHLHEPLAVPDSEIDQLAGLLAGAQKPVLLLGRGVKAAKEAALQLAEALSAAAITTLPARPLFPNDHELYAGGLGMAGSEASVRLLAESDRIVILGATWWPDEYVPTGAKIVQVDLNRAAMGAGHPLERGVTGDLMQILPKLAADPRLMGMDRSAWKARIREVAGEWKRQIEAEARQEGTPVPPQAVIRILSEKASDNAVLAVDTGDHTLWFNRIFQAKPQQDILISGRWRTLGWALPAAIAAQLASPDRQVIAVAGDGGAVQTLMEFQTAVELGLPVVLIVMNNGCYAMEANRMKQAGMTLTGSAIRNPDFAMLAQACGGIGMKAATAGEFEQCLSRALGDRKPALIEVATAPVPVPDPKRGN